MKIQKSFKIALNIILHSKLRSWLTVIGIVIGIAAIVAIVSVGQGAQMTLEQNLNSLSADILTVSSGFSRAMGAGGDFRGFGGGGEQSQSASATAPKNLTIKDVTTLRSVPNIVYVMGVISGSVDVSYLGKSTRASIQGVDPSIWKSFISTDLASGRYLTQADVDSVVIGGRVATSTFSDVAINRQITIGGQLFRIVGILKTSGGSEDSRIFMPIENAVNVLEGKNTKNFDSISIKIKDITITNDTINQITDRLMLSHGILQASKKDFSVNSPQAIQERIASTLSSITLFLTAIAAISLIVGAIGIMNSQFTSVLERTKEIGILKALGAKNRDILTIFLISSGIIGLIGGIFGIILGVLSSGFITGLSGGSSGSLGRFSLSAAYFSPTLIIEVFLISIVVGLVAGAVPAYRASRLAPVDALRYE